MAASWLGDLKDQAIHKATLRSQQVTTGTTNGVGVDVQLAEGPITLVVNVGAVTGTYTTLQLTVTESDDNTTFVAMSDAPATAQVMAANTEYIVTFWKRTKRYIRGELVATAGTNALVAAAFLAQKKILGGSGTQL